MSDTEASGGPVGPLDQIGIDVEDFDRSARFWSAVLGLKVASRSDRYLQFEREGSGLEIYLQKVPEKKTSKTRVHMDIRVTDLDVALARVEALGGRMFQRVEESGSQWIVVLDPDGTEFCLVLGNE